MFKIKYSHKLHLGTLALGTMYLLNSHAIKADAHHGHSHSLKAHVHGHCTLDIALEENTGQAQLSCPNESIFGFEHKATSTKHKRLQMEITDRFKRNADEYLVFGKEINCTQKLDSFKPFTNSKGNHSEVIAKFSIKCAQKFAGSTLKFKFSDYFHRIEQIKVQLITPKKQQGMTIGENSKNSIEL